MLTLDIDALRAINQWLPSLTRLAMSVSKLQRSEVGSAAASSTQLHGLQPCWLAITALTNLRSLEMSVQEDVLPSATFACWTQLNCFPRLSRLKLSPDRFDAASPLPLLQLLSLTELDLSGVLSEAHELEVRAAIAELTQQQPQRPIVRLRSPICLSRALIIGPKDEEWYDF